MSTFDVMPIPRLTSDPYASFRLPEPLVPYGYPVLPDIADGTYPPCQQCGGTGYSWDDPATSGVISFGACPNCVF